MNPKPKMVVAYLFSDDETLSECTFFEGDCIDGKHGCHGYIKESDLAGAQVI